MSAPARAARGVEDDEDLGRLLNFSREREGCRVTLYTDGRAAGERITGATVPALVVLDVMLPYVNGQQLLARIRESSAWKAVPVLMLTAKSAEADVVRAFDGGANDYLKKPFQPAELKARVRRLLPRP